MGSVKEMKKLVKMVTTVGLSIGLLAGHASVEAAGKNYTYYSYGDTANVTKSTTYGVNLMGGSTDVDEAMLWMAKKANGGDFVVLRASGSDGYNQYLYDLAAQNGAGLNSVETIVLNNRNAASDSFVLDKVSKAEAVFFAGGDQSLYVNYIKDTPLEDTLNNLISINKVPIGGTSAGLAIQGQFVYDAANGSVYSNEALSNPGNQYMTFTRNFLSNPYLTSTITDSHFEQRDRMGRFVGFMARNIMDGWTTQAKGIAVNEQTALLLEADGSAKVVSQPGSTNAAVYVGRTTSAPTSSLSAPLTMKDIEMTKLKTGDTFSFSNWSSSNGFQYKLNAQNGVLTSTTGNIYGN